MKYYFKKNINNLVDHPNKHVICSICNSKFSSFGDFGLINRKNAQCYSCGSLERHRLIWKYINEKTNLFKNNEKIKLLHFAPEKCFFNVFVKNQSIDYFPCDIMPEKYSNDKNIKIIKADITNLPFDVNFFDFILCSHVLEHVVDDKKAMSELYRVLKVGKMGIFQVPIDYNREVTYEDYSITDPGDREKAFGQSDHVRYYGQDYKVRLKNAGFNVLVDDYINLFTTEELFKFGLLPSQLIYVCIK